VTEIPWGLLCIVGSVEAAEVSPLDREGVQVLDGERTRSEKPTVSLGLRACGIIAMCQQTGCGIHAFHLQQLSSKTQRKQNHEKTYNKRA
jgi:hypothetical protein